MATLRSTLGLALLALAAPLVDGQAVNSLPQCGQSCIDTMIHSGGSLGCGDNSLTCLCLMPNFGFGIRDCAIAGCGDAVASTVTSAASALCATATLPVTSTTPATTPAASTPAAETTPPAATAATSPVTTIPAATSSTPAATPSTTSTAASSVNSQVAVQSSSSSAATTKSSTSSKTGSSASTGTAENNSLDNTTSSSASASSTSAASTGFSSLPTVAKAGIGVGIGVGALAVIGVFVLVRCMGRKKRNAYETTPGAIPARASRGGSSEDSMSRYGGSVSGTVNKKQRPALQISDPLQGSGRSYANDPHYAQYGGDLPPSSSGGVSGMSELDKHSRPYEEMVPRASPRHIV